MMLEDSSWPSSPNTVICEPQADTSVDVDDLQPNVTQTPEIVTGRCTIAVTEGVCD